MRFVGLGWLRLSMGLGGLFLCGCGFMVVWYRLVVWVVVGGCWVFFQFDFCGWVWLISGFSGFGCCGLTAFYVWCVGADLGWCYVFVDLVWFLGLWLLVYWVCGLVGVGCLLGLRLGGLAGDCCYLFLVVVRFIVGFGVYVGFGGYGVCLRVF